MTSRCVGLGELLWDVLPDGRQLGGAPANFAYHAAALGAQAQVISRVGRDEPGRALLERLDHLGVGTGAVEIDLAAPTSTVTVRVDPQGQPQYVIHENVAWDGLAGEPAAERAAAAADALCFGTLAQRSPIARATVRRLLAQARPGALRVFDVNLRQPNASRELIEPSLALASVLKVNDAELPRLAAMFGLAGDDRDQLAALRDRFGLRAVALTRGERGSLVGADGEWVDQPAQPVAVADTVGAGDAFTAALVLGLLARWPLAVIAERATALAGFVCTRRGATPRVPREISKPFHQAQAA